MSAPATPLSLNEIKFFFTRAAVGAGAPFGFGESFSKSLIFLAAIGLDPAAVAAPALDALAEGTSVPVAAFDDGPKGLTARPATEGAPVSAIYAGPAVADRLLLLAARGDALPVLLPAVDQPALVLAAIGTSSLAAPRIVISWHNGTDAIRMVRSGDGVDISGTTLAGLVCPAPASATVMLAEADGLPPFSAEAFLKARSGRLVEGVAVDGESFAAVQRHFRKCLVPSTDRSRIAGAGAGLTDND
ncbi:hypothetical protein GGD81_003793 [Rhodobium orientis]|uniref:DUF3726 domain-containing protein n=1 Tax=Rhodobium orientis TaxID=34017 RepID=A0A327JNR3_9HYPH|nr:DUF3726 domain-containing protein [Rhodobium orientis]MBB4304729.1 hypothetical protein [Rhodobium orientis]MBK5952067.1 hypothetical protein [Rhodobium orientis]RAI26532.1 hypothetical protein CH339_13780 [Rhodobium orientis]